MHREVLNSNLIANLKQCRIIRAVLYRFSFSAKENLIRPFHSNHFDFAILFLLGFKDSDYLICKRNCSIARLTLWWTHSPLTNLIAKLHCSRNSNCLVLEINVTPLKSYKLSGTKTSLQNKPKLILLALPCRCFQKSFLRLNRQRLLFIRRLSHITLH